MGMAGADVASAEARKSAADEQMWSGISGAVGSVGGGITDKLGM